VSLARSDGIEPLINNLIAMKKYLIGAVSAVGLTVSSIAFAADATSTAVLNTAIDSVTGQVYTNLPVIALAAVSVIATVFVISWGIRYLLGLIRRHAK